MMTRDEIIVLGQKASINYKCLDDSYCDAVGIPRGTYGTVEIRFDDFCKFAELVAAAEREECARLIEAWTDYAVPLAHIAMFIRGRK